MGKPTVHDIAKEAGVSLATVDRVLNGRPGVRDRTVERVQAAVRSLGYVRDTHAANLARQREYKFAFFLPEGGNQFIAMLRAALAEAVAVQPSDRIAVHIHDIPAFDAHAAARALNALRPETVDGVAVMLPETPPLRDAVARLKEAAVPVVALVSDLPNSARDHFVGIDNRAAGRTAGVLMGRFLSGRQGRVAVLVNSTQSRDMLERRAGFDEAMVRDFADIETLPSLEGHDDHQLAARVLASCLEDRQPLLGLYCAGGGLRGVTRVLRERGLSRDVVVVAHELTPHSRQGLEDGVLDVLIVQNAGHLVRSALRVLKAKSDGAAIVEAQERIRIEVLIRENL